MDGNSIHGDGAMVDRLTRLRRAHEVLAYELSAAQRRLRERDREVRELRAAVDAYRTMKTIGGKASLRGASRAA